MGENSMRLVQARDRDRTYDAIPVGRADNVEIIDVPGFSYEARDTRCHVRTYAPGAHVVTGNLYTDDEILSNRLSNGL
jgi:hypothetical protein